MNSQLRSVLRRLEHEATVWRQEPIRRVAVRNKLLRPLRVRQFHSFGANSFVDRPLWLYGPRLISIGEGVMILRGSWLAVERVAWDRPAPVMEIGDRVGIRFGCTISAAESIVIEDDVGLAAMVTVIDSVHGWAPGQPNALYGPLNSAPIRIGRGTSVGDRVTVAAGADIGEQCMIAANSVVNKKIPDFSVVAGNPGRVVGSTRK